MTRLTLSAACIAILMAIVAVPSNAQRTEARRVQDAAAVFQAIIGVPEREVPQALMRTVYGIAIFPEVQRVGFVIAVQRGKGVLVVRGSDGTWSRPLFLTLTGGSVGWQAGIQSADLVLFFKTRDSVERVLRGKYTLGVDASVAAGSLGRGASAVTDQDLRAEIYSYSRTRGIFAGFAVQGAAIDVDYDASSLYFGKDINKPEDVFSGAGLPDPPSAVQLRQAIAGYQKNLR